MVKTSKPSLAETHPELAAQADGWDPGRLTFGSHAKVAWKCELLHTWVAGINSRSRGSGCPICAGKKVLAGFNDLETIRPEIAAQADGWDPSTLTVSSMKKRRWICELGHTWDAVVASRSRGSGCPFCSNNSVWVGFNDLATTHPGLALEAKDWDPKCFTRGSKKTVKWKCLNGHEWSAPIQERTKTVSICPSCTGKSRRLIRGHSDLASRRPDLAAEAYGWDPSTKTFGSGEKVQWKCGKGHIYKTTVNNRTSQDWNCPICANRKLLTGYNDLRTTNPILATEMIGDSTQVMAGAGAKARWRCSAGHTYEASPKERTSHETGCPFCTGRKVLSGFNDVFTTHPKIALELVDIDPRKVSAGMSRTANWKCHLGHVYKAKISDRCGSHKSGCPICSGRKVLKGFNDLQTVAPSVASGAHGWDPSTLTISSGRKMEWICEKNHVFKQVVADRTGQNRGCPVCSGRYVLAGFNDLATLRPEIAAQADGWDPSTVTVSSGRKKRWICENGHKYWSMVASRTGGTGCPSCARFGFDPNKEGWLYLIDQDDLQMLQIGISNFPENRLSQHATHGWEVIEVRGPMEGHLVQKLETAILHAVERRGALLGHKAHIEKFDGYSEAWTKDSLSVTSFKQLLDWVYQDDENIVSRDGN
jgi:plastocyanin